MLAAEGVEGVMQLSAVATAGSAQEPMCGHGG